MIIKSLTIKGFKCFREKTTIKLDSMTCLVGTNGSGKTAVLEALCRLFGDTPDVTTIRKSDFYVTPGENFEDKPHKELYIEVLLAFPELEIEGDCSVIPEVFNNMTIDGEYGTPFCRVRLEAVWEKSDTSEGNIESEIYWITTNSDEIKDENRKKFRLSDKNLIRVYYIPSTRDPSFQIKIIAGSVIQRLFSAIEWNPEISSVVENYASELQKEFGKEQGIQIIQNELSDYWNKYAGDGKYKNIVLSPIEIKKDFLFKKINAQFQPGETDSYDTVESLSDGTKSLFYLSLLNTLYDIENKVKEGGIESFNKDKISKAYLTIFALEEPENHLAPHYLGRIIKIFRELCQKGSQTILSSHSPSIIKRINPEEIRYLKLKNNIYTEIKEIVLPNKLEGDEISTTYKYIKGAIQAYPELYFSKLVILGEGESEQLIIPKIAKCLNIDMDTSFISFVPLSGRFVNHFWRLLEALEIPYLTLLDFDKGRNTGGEDKFVYISDQLLECKKITEEQKTYLTDSSQKESERLIFLENLNVFFSYPIDIDFYMLKNFFDEYTNSKDYPTGPKIPLQEDINKSSKDKSAIAAVLKKDKDEITEYDESDSKYYYWYRYLFLYGSGKPAAHLIGISNIIDNNKPVNHIYENLFAKIKEYLK